MLHMFLSVSFGLNVICNEAHILTLTVFILNHTVSNLHCGSVGVQHKLAIMKPPLQNCQCKPVTGGKKEKKSPKSSSLYCVGTSTTIQSQQTHQRSDPSMTTLTIPNMAASLVPLKTYNFRPLTWG
jgi:hypothetical protein